MSKLARSSLKEAQFLPNIGVASLNRVDSILLFLYSSVTQLGNGSKDAVLPRFNSNYCT